MALFVVMQSDAVAKSQLAAIEGVSYNVNATMADNLKILAGKKISVTTVSGKTSTGTIKEIGDHFIHLEKLEGKEYFDALIRLENIVLIETMFRTTQR